MKITERDLKRLLVGFSNIPIKIRMYDCLIGNIDIKESKCKFIRKCNKLSFIDKTNNNMLQINTEPLYKIETNEDNSSIWLYMDYNLKIIIEKIPLLSVKYKQSSDK